MVRCKTSHPVKEVFTCRPLTVVIKAVTVLLKQAAHLGWEQFAVLLDCLTDCGPETRSALSFANTPAMSYT